MADFTLGSVVLPASKQDLFPIPAGQDVKYWAANDANVVFTALNSLRSAVLSIAPGAALQAYATPPAASGILIGNVADGSSAVGTVVDNVTAISNAAGKLLSIRNAGVEKAYFDPTGSLALAGTTIIEITANTGLILKGNRNAADTGSDVVLNGQATRTAGNIADFQNNATSKFSVDFNGKHVFPTGGAAAVVGKSVLVAGTVTVSTTAVTANSIILLTRQVVGGTVGDLRVGTITAATSFVINSVSGTDTSTVSWMIIN
jgi:hypothetical protein